MHLLIKPGPASEPASPGQRIALASYAYLEGIAVEEYIGGGTEADVARARRTRRRRSSRRGRGSRPRRPPRRRPRAGLRGAAGRPRPDGLGARQLPGDRPARPRRARGEGHHRRELVAVTTAQVRRLPPDRDGPRRQGGDRGRRHRRRRQARRVHHRCRRRVVALLARVHPGRPDGPPDEPLDAPAAQRRLRHRRAAPADAGRPALAHRPRPGRHPGRSRSRSTPRTRSARSPAPSTRSTARPSGSPPSRPCCGATSTRSSPTSRAATSR